jgi:hypothetical protein
MPRQYLSYPAVYCTQVDGTPHPHKNHYTVGGYTGNKLLCITIMGDLIQVGPVKNVVHRSQSYICLVPKADLVASESIE